MTTHEELPQSVSSGAVAEGDVYSHEDHGHVRVTAIWKQTQRVDEVQNPHGDELIVVRFLPGDDTDWSNELAEQAEDFLDSIG